MNKRNKRITIRLNDKEYQMIKEEAEKNNIEPSRFIRESSVTFAKGVSDSKIECQERLTNNEQHKIVESLIQLEYYIECLPEKSKHKPEMKGLVEDLWHSLK